MTSLAHSVPSLSATEMRPRTDAGEITALALLNCAVRELCAPGRQVWPADPYLLLRLPHAGVMLRARLLRPPLMTPRLAAPVEELREAWSPIGWRRLAKLVADELELTTGTANPEFADQITASHDAVSAMISDGRTSCGDPYLDSEQALLAGHRFHPTPKARQGTDWRLYAPETGRRFPLHWLAVREDAITEEGDTTLLDRLGPPVREGYRVLPAHPWQLALLRPASDAVIDLGPYGPEAVPTSSVRTVYVPDAFLKFSLDVRITNCVRKNAWYELSGVVALTRALRPVFDGLSAGLLGEPGYRTVDLGDRRLHEGLGVIVREGVRGFAGTPLLAAAIADPYARSGAAVSRLLAGSSPEHLLAWWDAYVRHVAPPVLRAYLEHGVVLEPHLQNVLVSVDGDGMPVGAVFRDLEGTKLLPGPWASFLAGLPGPVADAMAYEPERGWNRVVYCLFVNHLAEVAAAVADLCPPLERELWRLARHHVARCAPPGGETVTGGSARLRALLAGVPMPAKANLRIRWARDPDREAAYVTVPNPLADLERIC